VAGIGALFAFVGGALSLVGWRWLPLIGLLLSGLAGAGAARLGRIRQRSRFQERIFGWVRLVGAGLGVAGLSRMLALGSGQWGWWLTGGVLVAAMLGLSAERRLSPAKPPIWLASVDTLIWAMLPFAAFGHWDWGMGAVTGYAAASFAWVEGVKLRDIPPTD